MYGDTDIGTYVYRVTYLFERREDSSGVTTGISYEDASFQSVCIFVKILNDNSLNSHYVLLRDFITLLRYYFSLYKNNFNSAYCRLTLWAF